MRHSLRRTFERFYRDTSGSTAIEYALIGVLVGLGIIAGLSSFGSSTNGTWGNMQGDVSNAIN